MYSSAATISFAPPMTPRLDSDVVDVPILRQIPFPRRYRKDEEIFAEGDPASHYYRVISGFVRTSKLLCDGRRQIDSFYVAGEIFGIELRAEHRVTAEAIGDTMVVRLPRCSLTDPVDTDRALAREVVTTTLVNLERAQQHVILLGRRSAAEKVAAFLLDMAARVQGSKIDLPMSRGDIADYLGLTIETVSRTLTRFERQGTIEFSFARRTLRLRNMPVLRHLDS